MQAQIAASLRHLKKAAAHLSDAALAIGDADKAAAANIDRRARRDQAARTIELPAGLTGIAPLLELRPTAFACRPFCSKTPSCRFFYKGTGAALIKFPIYYSKQRCGAMPLVIVGHGSAAALLHRQSLAGCGPKPGFGSFRRWKERARVQAAPCKVQQYPEASRRIWDLSTA